jgi:O-antigen/teichoic acid export membrane protein
MAFLLRVIAMAAGSLLSLLWFRLLVFAMGKPLFGLFDSFLAVTRLGGLGDLGISGALAIKAGSMLGGREEEGLQKLLASARALFVVMAGGLFMLFLVLSPWLPRWMHFHDVPGAGSLTTLFIFGGASVALLILSGYFASLNYAHGTVTWPILPTVFISQMLAPFLHWRLAAAGAPLWVQCLPYLLASALNAVVGWRMLKWSHPWLGNLLPLKFSGQLWKILAGASGWVYLCSLGNVIYTTTDRLVLQAGIGPEVIAPYRANTKVCDLAVSLILTASFVSLPKITQWISSSNAADRKRLLVETNRLNIFQIVLGCGAALGYLALNDLFIYLWMGPDFNCPLVWQIAFAANLVVTTGGDASIQIATRCGDQGLKRAGLAIGMTGLLNLGLSIFSVLLSHRLGVTGAIAGVAVATVIAQSVLSLGLSWHICRHLGFSFLRWTLKCWLLPLGIVLSAAVLKDYFPKQSFSNLGWLLSCYVILFFAACWLAGMNTGLLRSEFAFVRSIFNKKTV